MPVTNCCLDISPKTRNKDMTGLLGCPSREVHVVGHVVPVVLRRVGGWVSQLTIVEICWDKGDMMENVGGNCNSTMFTGWWNLFQTYAVVIRNGGHLWVSCPDPIQAVVAWVQGGSHPPSELPSTFSAFCYTFSIKSIKSHVVHVVHVHQHALAILSIHVNVSTTGILMKLKKHNI